MASLCSSKAQILILGLDDAPWRAFNTMVEYRAWCEANLPDYLGFKPAL